MITTDAWVLHRGDAAGRGRLQRERFQIQELADDEALVQPLYGCWEGNMDHALRRSPVDVCQLRCEERVVLGNAGVVRVLRCGPGVRSVREGDVCLLFCNGTPDEHGYPIDIFGYDAPGTVGLLAKVTKTREHQLVPVPRGSRHSLAQWAAFSLRYVTAWANWNVAHACFRAQMPDVPPEEVHVWGWGGGVALAELTLAHRLGCRATMIASTPSRLALIRSLGLQAVDRRSFGEASLEQDLLEAVRKETGGRGVSIFVDNVGSAFRATLKALGRQGVITTSGWKNGAAFPVVRAAECIGRHVHVFTHYARHSEGVAAVRFAEETGWAPPAPTAHYAWEEVPRLADDYSAGRIDDYTPIYTGGATDSERAHEESHVHQSQ